MGFYISEDTILHNRRRKNLKSYIALTAWALWRRSNVSPVRYDLSFYIPEGATLHSHHHENLKFYNNGLVLTKISTNNMQEKVTQKQKISKIL
jgi:hypothetical protein